MLTELEKAHQGLSEHQRWGDVRRRMEKAMARADSALETGENYPAFVSAALRFADRAMLLGRDLDPAVNFLERGLTLAEKRNDRRRRGLIQLTLGRVFMMSSDRDRAFSALSEGAAGVMELGDDDILEQTARPLSLFYFLQGRYREALDHAESALKRLYRPNVQWFQTAPITVASLSAAFLGQYHRSVGMLDFHCHFVRQNGRADEPNAAYIPQAMLGLLLDLMDEPRQARLHLDRAWSSLAADNRHGRIIALRALAFHFHQKGDLEKAAETAGRIRKMAGRRAVGSIYTPWVLEMYHDLERKGFGEATGWAFQEVFDALMEGPNAHLRGAALRLRAADALARGETAEAVLNRLSESETLLKSAEDPVQLALTRIEMARLKLRQGKREEGAALAIKARRDVAGVREAVFPDDLQALLGSHLPPEINARADENLDRVFTLFEDISPALTGAFPDAFLSAANRFFLAEHSAIFRFAPGEDAPDLLAAWNLAETDAAGEGFREVMAEIRESIRENRPITDRDVRVPDLGKRLSVVCIPFEAGEGAAGVLYAGKEYPPERLTIDEKAGRRLSRLLSACVRENRRHSQKLRKVQTTLKRSIRQQEWAEDIIFPTPGLAALAETGRRAAASTSPVLILGETGTGKEVLAHWLHEQSPRRDNPFIVLEPTAIPATLIESDLFGHEKGAFTGADRRRIGKVELAHGGTLFIDEVGEIPKEAQVKLLRVLEDKSIRRIGGRGDIRSDFRLMAATNRNLSEEVARGRFRQDLFYRLHVIDMTLPPLRDRPEDISPLARHFLSRFARKNGRPHLVLSSQDEARLADHDWPGNIRELRNVIDRSALLTAGETLELDLPSPRRPCPEPDDWPDMDELQRRYIRAVLEKTGGKISGPGGAAEILGMKRATLYARMGKLGLR